MVPDLSTHEADAASYFRARMNVDALLDLGFQGAGVRVGVVDTGVDASEISGPEPLAKDFTGDGDAGDRPNRHGTRVAECIRRIAPKCEIVNAKVVPRAGSATKSGVARAIDELVADDLVDIVNISLSFPPGRWLRRCLPVTHFVADSRPDEENPNPEDPRHLLAVTIVGHDEIEPGTACELCTVCDRVAASGVPIVVAVGNSWGKPAGCPGRSPGVLVAESTALGEEWAAAWSTKPWIQRLWDWRVRGDVGDNWGTSFSAGYASGLVALLMPYVRRLGWFRARRILTARRTDGPATVDALRVLHDMQATLGDFDDPRYGATSAAEVDRASQVLAAARWLHDDSMAGHAKALDIIGAIDPHDVPAVRATQVSEYLTALVRATSGDPNIRRFFTSPRRKLPALERAWARVAQARNSDLLPSSACHQYTGGEVDDLPFEAVPVPPLPDRNMAWQKLLEVNRSRPGMLSFVEGQLVSVHTNPFPDLPPPTIATAGGARHDSSASRKPNIAERLRRSVWPTPAGASSDDRRLEV